MGEHPYITGDADILAYVASGLTEDHLIYFARHWQAFSPGMQVLTAALVEYSRENKRLQEKLDNEAS